ncbi:MAG: hypothetical protein IJA14_02385, partial [Alphaproteobacteria bacterium]|nr:hypothetical protein [Alphaproteobacteria bacterium]
MIYGTERNACKAKKIDRGGVEPCKTGKKPLNVLKNNNNQTFTIYRYSILFARIRKILKIKVQNSIFAKFLTRLARHPLISLTKLSAPQTSVLKNASRGYVMVLVAVFIPVILLGTKLVLDSRQESEHKVGKIFKKCAKECALKVA